MQSATDFINAGQDAFAGSGRCAWDLEAMHVARRRTENEVREGPANVGADKAA
jgi:hypothetical protein